MADILITEFMDEASVDALRASFSVDYDPGLADAQADIPARLVGCKAIIVRNRTQVTEGLLAAGPNLTCVGRLGVGLDNIDQSACAAAGVTVYPALGANNLSVAEYVLTTALVLLRGAYRAKHSMLAGRWPRQALSGREVSGTTLGLIGYGSIARDTAKLARAFGCEIIAFDPMLPADNPLWEGARSVDLDALLKSADIVSLHVPLTPETKHLINTQAIDLMKPDAILINAARGGVVDEDALAAAMHNGKLGGAALDVFENEPLGQDDAAKFKGLEDLILTPHIAGVTDESNTRVSAMIADKVSEHLNAN